MNLISTIPNSYGHSDRNASMFILLIILSMIVSAHALTVSIGTTAPTVNGADIAQLTETDADWGSSVLWGDRPARGQTFMTGSAKYLLYSVTIKSIGSQSANGTYTLRIGTIIGTTFTQIVSETSATITDDVAVDDYITFVLDVPLELNSGELYGFDIGRSGSGWNNYRNTDDSSYGSGTSYSSGSNGAGDSNISTHGFDRVFHIDMAAKPNGSILMIQ
jgi:hypothetical protein